MEIKVLGTGCAKCKTLMEYTEQAVEKLGVSASVEKVEDFEEMMKLGVLSTPALVVDGKVLLKGRVAEVSELVELLSK